MFERDFNGDLHWLRYDHGNDKYERRGEPHHDADLMHLVFRSVSDLRAEADEAHLRTKLLFAANGSAELTDDDMEDLLRAMTDTAFHLSQQLGSLEESLAAEVERIEEERKASEPEPEPPGPEHHLWLAIMKTKPADDDPKLAEWRAECERARAVLVSKGKQPEPKPAAGPDLAQRAAEVVTNLYERNPEAGLVAIAALEAIGAPEVAQ